MKTCTACGANKSETEFYRTSGRPGLRQPCKRCTAERTRARRDNSPEARAARAAKVRAYRAADPVRRRKRYVRVYGITLDEYNAILASQGGGCAICGATECTSGAAFSIDHDHNCCPGQRSCGKCVRGVLCRTCNIGIGNLKDSADVLRAAASYLDGYLAEGAALCA